jgi:hypothetical protein
LSFHGCGPWRALLQNLAWPSGRAGMEPAVCGMFSDPEPSRSGGRGPPGPSDSSRCARMAAFGRGLCAGVAGCLGARTTYEQFSFFLSAITLAFLTFAVEKAFPSWRRCMVSQLLTLASHSPGILNSRERSAAAQGPAMAYIGLQARTILTGLPCPGFHGSLG